MRRVDGDSRGGGVLGRLSCGPAAVILCVATPVVAQAPEPTAAPEPAAGAAQVSVEDALAGLTAPSPEDRKAAIRVLSATADRTAVPDLIRVLRGDPDAEVRRYAVVALANIRDPAAIPDLAESASADPSPVVREAATQALGTFGVAPVAAPPVVAPAVVAPPPPPGPAPGPVPSPGGIGVLQTAGAPVSLGAMTMLQFDSEDPGVEIAQVVGAHQEVRMVDGRPRPTTVPTAQSVCRTPCSLEVPNGSYTFAAES